MKRRATLLTSAALLAIGCAMMQTASAGWDQVGAFYEEIDAQNLERCEFRLRFDDGRTPFGQRSLYIPAATTMEYPDEYEDVQNLEFPIDYRTIVHIADRGALDQNQFNEFEQRHIFGDRQPFDTHFNLVLPTHSPWIANQYQPLMLTYFQASAGGSIDTYMIDTAPAYFSLEQNCEPAPVITGFNITASSQYASFDINQVVDGNESSYWIGGQNKSPWILTLYFDQNYSLDQLNISWYSSSYQPQDLGLSYMAAGDPDYTGIPLVDPTETENIDLSGVVANQLEIVIPYVISGSFPVIREIDVRGSKSN